MGVARFMVLVWPGLARAVVVMGLIAGSEPLRVQEGEDEIAQQGDGHDQADDVLGGHSFATPLATRATSAKTAIVVTTKARSAIVSS
ncbi:hypothetical protein GCM10009730_06160 [Streptomyces albidochromogenes]